MDLATIKDVFDHFGVPLGILFVMGFSIWRVAKWVAPRADRTIERHISFVDKVTEVQQRNAEVLTRIADRQEATCESVSKLSEAVGTLCEHVKAIDCANPYGNKGYRGQPPIQAERGP